MKIKGSALLHGMTFLASRQGEAALEQFKLSLPPSLGAVVRIGIHAHGWYPVPVWNALLAEVERTCGGAASVREVAAFIAQKDLTAPYRVLLSIGSPTILFRRAGLFWSKYFDGGSFEGSPEGPNRFRTLLRAGVDPASDPSPLTCSIAVPAWQEHAMKLTGATGGRSRHVKCRYDQNLACEFEIRWDD